MKLRDCGVLILGFLVFGLIIAYGASHPQKAQGAWYDFLNPSSYGVEAPNLNLTADGLYLPKSGEFRGGYGADLAKWKSLYLRAQYVEPQDGKNEMYGLGLSVNVTDAISKSGGQWLGKVGLTVGASAVFDVKDVVNKEGAGKKEVDVEPAIYASLKILEF